MHAEEEKWYFSITDIDGILEDSAYCILVTGTVAKKTIEELENEV